MSFYVTAIQGLPLMLLQVENPIGNFKRKLYADAFRRYYEQHLPTMEAMENGYQQVVDKEQYITNMAEAIVQAAEGELQKETKKRNKENRLMDFNFCLVGYLYPAIQEFPGESGKVLAKRLAKVWKEHFPQTNVTPSNFDQINNGFKRKFCYITTAVCTTMGKPDDCYELNCFRTYRDTYLMATEDGEEIVREYYDIAPTIVKHINREKNSRKIYEGIWDHYLKPCLHMIEEEQNQECKALYIQMVRDLEKEYFYKN